MDIDLYDQRIRLGPGWRVQIGILRRGDTTLAVSSVTFFVLACCSDFSYFVFD